MRTNDTNVSRRDLLKTAGVAAGGLAAGSLTSADATDQLAGPGCPTLRDELRKNKTQ